MSIFLFSLYFLSCEVISIKTIKLVIDNSVLNEYNDYYFSIHKRAKKPPIKNPYHESINEWMIMDNFKRNNLKQQWKMFIIWFIEKQGYANLRIEKCEMKFTAYYKTNRRHDADNSCPKFILDGFCESGFVVDDDIKHISSITLKCDVDKNNPRTEIEVYYE